MRTQNEARYPRLGQETQDYWERQRELYGVTKRDERRWAEQVDKALRGGRY